MLQAFLMVLREGFEAFLIVAVIFSYLAKSDKDHLRSAVYVAIGVSLGVSGLLGWLLMRGVNEALWEGILGVVTIVMVGGLVVHMWRAAPRLKEEIHQRLEKATSKRSEPWAYLGVFLFTLFMITREGMETALMLLQVRGGDVLSGIFMGLAASAAVAWLWARFSHLINIKRFFQVTGVFLLLFMVQVAIYSFHEFSEAGLLPNSEAIHIATEPYSPVGIYGRWFPIVMVLSCVFWLIGGWIVDRFSHSGPPAEAVSQVGSSD